MTQRWVARELAKRGHDVATQSVSGWERGTFAPDRAKAEALDVLLGGEGQLLDALGYAANDQALDGRVAQMETELAEVLAALAKERGSAPRAGSAIEKRYDRIEAALARLEARFDAIERRLDEDDDPVGEDRPNTAAG